MNTIVFYETVDALSVKVEAYHAEEWLWTETANKQGLSDWIKQALQEGKLCKDDHYYWMVPEQVLMRRYGSFPEKATKRQQEKMAAHLLQVAFGETSGAVRLQAIDHERVAICGIKKQYCEEYTALLGRYYPWFQWASMTEWLLASADQAPRDGYYVVEAPSWTSVVAVYQQQLIANGTGSGQQEEALLNRLIEDTEAFQLSPVLQWCPIKNSELSQREPSKEMLIARMRTISGVHFKDYRLFAALCIGCLVLPSVFLLMGPKEASDSSLKDEQVASVESGIQHSDYSVLLAQAYAAKSDRITLLNHQAADGMLAISGRCSETLDIADYMKQLEKSTQALHPVLLDMVQKTEEKTTYYEFVVQISAKEAGEVQ